IHVCFLLSSVGPAAVLQLHSFPTRRSSDLCCPMLQSGYWTGSTPCTRFMVPKASPLLPKRPDGCAFMKQKPPAPTRSHVRCAQRSEEHTSELQSRFDLVCRLLLEKKKSVNK